MVIHAATAEPQLASATWPSDIWPAQPVRTTSDRTVIVNRYNAANRSTVTVPNHTGTIATRAPPTTTRPRPTARTSGRRASSGGTGRVSPIESAVVALSSRLNVLRRASSATRMTTAVTAPMSASASRALSLFHTMPDCTMPKASDPVRTALRSERRPITAAASDRRKNSRPSAPPTGSPRTLARSHSARNARPVARDHTTVCTALTGMPSVPARSGSSAR